MENIKNEIRMLIASELKGDLAVSNWHGVELSRCLVEPYVDTFENSFAEGQTVDLYVVLKEDPEKNAGYQIVYDPQCGEFGLSILGKERRRVFLGYYGTFLETLEGM